MGKQSEAVKVDKNVPFPPEAPHGRPSRYPWRDLKKGESFIYGGNLDAAKSAANYYNIRTDMTFRARLTDDGKVRVWRMK